MNPASKDIVEILEDESSLGLVFGTNLFVGLEPDQPSDCVTIFDTPGAPPQLTLTQGENYFHPSIQIRVRHTSYVSCWGLINDIKNLLHGMGQETIGDTLYTMIRCSIEPFMLDWDAHGCARFVTTFDIHRR